MEGGFEQVRLTAPDALSNLIAVLELGADGALRYSADTRRPNAATVKLIDDALVGGDFYDETRRDIGPIAAYAWPLLIQVGGLARLGDAEDLTLELTAAGERVLSEAGYAHLGTLWRKWLGNVTYDEFARVDAIRGQRRPGTLTPVPARRDAVAAALAAARPGIWTDVADVLHAMRAGRPSLAVTRSFKALWRLYIGDSYYGSLGHAGSHAWEIIETRYALCLLFEYAATLGLIDIRYWYPAHARDDYRWLPGASELPYLSRYDGLTALRVNELGAAILHGDDAELAAGDLPRPRRISATSRRQPRRCHIDVDLTP